MPLVPSSSRGGSGGGGSTLVQAFGPIGSTQAAFTWSGIPATGTGLMITGQVRTNNAGQVTGSVFLRMNNDSGANYQSQYLVENAGVATTAVSAGDTGLRIETSGALGLDAATFVIVIPNYLGSTFQKAAWIADHNFAAAVQANMRRGWWQNTAALTRVDLVAVTGSLDIGSQASLYLLA